MLPIARHTFTELSRDGRFRLTAALLVVLTVVAGLAGWQQVNALRAEAAAAATGERGRWLDQGNKNPHSAAHYGIYAFKEPRPLAVVDPGVQAYLGSAVYLEAHKQNEPLYRPAQDGTALQRFGDLSPALVGQALLPLLVILLGFAAFAGERERLVIVCSSCSFCRSRSAIRCSNSAAAGRDAPLSCAFTEPNLRFVRGADAGGPDATRRGLRDPRPLLSARRSRLRRAARLVRGPVRLSPVWHAACGAAADCAGHPGAAGAQLSRAPPGAPSHRA